MKSNAIFKEQISMKKINERKIMAYAKSKFNLNLINEQKVMTY
jgi:hypothetical protein